MSELISFRIVSLERFGYKPEHKSFDNKEEAIGEYEKMINDPKYRKVILFGIDGENKQYGYNQGKGKFI